MIKFKNTEVDISSFLWWMSTKANNLATSAAHNGSMSDGGARNIRNDASVYQAGMSLEVPAIWEEYVKEYIDKHAEWNEYQRLKSKFNGK